MAGEIIVVRDLTADNADVLAGTDLENIPGIGNLDVFVVSDQADTLVTITAPGQATPVRAQAAIVKTVANIDVTSDIPISLDVFGGKYIIAIDEQTAATAIRVMAVFTPAEED